MIEHPHKGRAENSELGWDQSRFAIYCILSGGTQLLSSSSFYNVATVYLPLLLSNQKDRGWEETPFQSATPQPKSYIHRGFICNDI